MGSKKGLISCIQCGRLIKQAKSDFDDEHSVSDNRLLVLAEEFAAILRAAERPGNTLTAHIQAATKIVNKNSINGGLISSLYFSICHNR